LFLKNWRLRWKHFFQHLQILIPMSRISRRQFCQFAGGTLASLGLSQLNITRQADRYGQVLAKSTPRKVALLVGINQYRYPDALSGCVTDVALQRQLLMYRFGFKSQDIHTLIDEKATRKNILGAFEEYLINQVKPGDVVVFHYSGHGSQIYDPEPTFVNAENGKIGLNSTFVPVDSQLPAGYPNSGGVVQDIMGHTLFLLMSAVPTENITVVLDSCFSGGGTRNDFKVRSRNGGKNILVSPDEKSYQKRWLSRLKLSHSEFVEGYRKGVAKGVVLAATDPYQLAADAQLNGFNAGAFTYLLTQHLWQQDSTVKDSIAQVTQDIPKDYNQTPRYDVKVGSGYESQPVYFIKPGNPPAQAVITSVQGNRAKLWLGGLDVEDVDDGTEFTIIGASGRSAGKVTLKSRDGLVGEAIVQGVVKPGALLQK
jgi:hypothetical protein